MKFETKYNLMDKLWFVFEDKIRCAPITEISCKAASAEIRTVYLFYLLGTGKTVYKTEDALFLTKEELLKSL